MILLVLHNKNFFSNSLLNLTIFKQNKKNSKQNPLNNFKPTKFLKASKNLKY